MSTKRRMRRSKKQALPKLDLAQQSGRSVEESQEAIDKYFHGFKILKEWLDSTATM